MKWVQVFFVLSIAAGCREDEDISRYRVHKSETSAAKPKTRLVATIFPHGDSTWFFKLVGPAAVVDGQAEEFERFIRSVRFTPNAAAPLEWHVPTSWRKGPEAATRYAAFLLGPKDDTAAMTVIKLGKNAGSLLANVNRWREQIGLLPLAVFELDHVSKPVEVNGVSATWVDMSSAEALTAP
jgi:hypothetical protein